MNSLSIAVVGAHLSTASVCGQQSECCLPANADWQGFFRYLGLAEGSRIALTLETPELSLFLQNMLKSAGMQVKILGWNMQSPQAGERWCSELEEFDPDWCFLTSALYLELPFSYWGRVCWEQDLRWQLQEFSAEQAA